MASGGGSSAISSSMDGGAIGGSSGAASAGTGGSGRGSAGAGSGAAGTGGKSKEGAGGGAIMGGGSSATSSSMDGGAIRGASGAFSADGSGRSVGCLISGTVGKSESLLEESKLAGFGSSTGLASERGVSIFTTSGDDVGGADANF